VIEYRRRQKLNNEEKLFMQKQFETELAKTQVEVQEETRRHLATELHDNIGQLLSLTSVTIASVNMDNRDKSEQKLADVQNLITRSIKELRQLSKIIHGEQLTQLGLTEAIQQEINWIQRTGHYTVQFINRTKDLSISNKDKDLFVYRLLQETLNNILKHAEATAIDVELTFSNNKLFLKITDNGKGFDVNSMFNKKEGLGLQSMKKRTQLLKGEMSILSDFNEGTSVSFSIPYP
jgi:signal transduction histidine kinase